MLSTQAPTHSARAHRTPTAGQGRHDLPVPGLRAAVQPGRGRRLEHGEQGGRLGPGRRADPCGLDVRARLGPDPGSWSWQGLAGRRATRGGGLMFTDPEDFQPEGLTEAGRQLLEVYRVLLADSELGDGGRLVSKISEERLAAKPAGRRLSWLKVVPRQHRSGPHKGEFIGNRYVLLLGYEEATAEAARIEGSRPKMQVRAKDHVDEPRITAEPRITPEQPVSPGQSQGSQGVVILPNRESLAQKKEVGTKGVAWGSRGGASDPDSTAALDEPSPGDPGWSAMVAERSVEREVPESGKWPAFPSMAAEKAWVALQRRRAREAEPTPAVPVDEPAEPARVATVHRGNGDRVAVLWDGDVGRVLDLEVADAMAVADPDVAGAMVALGRGGLLDGATVPRDAPRGSALSEYYRVTPPRDEEVTG